MRQYVILRRNGWNTPEELHLAAERSRQVSDGEMQDQVRWIRTYVLAEEAGSLGTVCVYEGESPEAIRRHADRAGLPCDEILPIADTMVVRPDPQTAATV